MVKVIPVIQNTEYYDILFHHFGAVIVVECNRIANRKFPSVDLCRIVVVCRKNIVSTHQFIIIGTSVLQISGNLLCLFFGQRINHIIVTVFIVFRIVKSDAEALNFRHLFHTV